MKKSFLTVLTFLAVFSLPHLSYALDQLPLPNAGVSPVQAEVFEFASADMKPAAKDPCEKILRHAEPEKHNRIRAIKAYRHCRSERALGELEVWSWQDARNDVRP